MKEELIMFGIIIFGILAFILIIIITMQFIDITFFNSIPTKIYINENLVFEGINGCLDIISGGDTTTIKTYKGFLCFFPDKIYTDEEIKVIGKN